VAVTATKELRKVISYRYIRVTAFKIRKTPITQNCYKRDDCPRHLAAGVIRTNACSDIVTTGATYIIKL